MNSKDDLFQLITETLASIPFGTVESYKDVLFDKEQSEDVGEEIEFLRNTTLSDISFEDVDNPKQFRMKNSKDGSILLSNRQPTLGELRGANLIAFLKQQKELHPDETTYDCITKAIRSPEFSDVVYGLKKVLIARNPKSAFYPPMTERFFNHFINDLLNRIQKKICKKTLEDNLDPMIIIKDKESQERIWEGIDIETIYNLTSLFQPIEDKCIDLKRRGYLSAANIVKQLYKDLSQSKERFLNGDISADDFKTECTGLIDNAKKTELRHHRGFCGIVLHRIEIELNAITFGRVAITPTHSIQQVHKLKNGLSGFFKEERSSVNSDDTSEQLGTSSSLRGGGE